LPFAGAQKHPGPRSFTTAGSQLLH
jgi:hypothetical protein